MTAAVLDREKLVRTLRMFGSTDECERIAAGREAERLRREAGMTWGDLLVPTFPDNSPLDRALSYSLNNGWPVFPCNARKEPITDHGFYDATVDPDQIERWWTTDPYALIGVPTGEVIGLIVVDLDMKDGKDGVAEFVKLECCPIMPPVPTVRTPSGGLHLYYQRPDGGLRNSVSKFARGIDIRGDGGYVILPSPGSGYRWEHWHFGNCQPLPAPAWLLPREAGPNPFLRRFLAGARVNGLAGARVNGLAGVLRALHGAAHGERNSLLFWAACRFADAVALGLIGEDSARVLLHQRGNAVGLDDREITKTVNSAFGAGSARHV